MYPTNNPIFSASSQFILKKFLQTVPASVLSSLSNPCKEYGKTISFSSLVLWKCVMNIHQKTSHFQAFHVHQIKNVIFQTSTELQMIPRLHKKVVSDFHMLSWYTYNQHLSWKCMSGYQQFKQISISVSRRENIFPFRVLIYKDNKIVNLIHTSSYAKMLARNSSFKTPTPSALLDDDADWKTQ